MEFLADPDLANLQLVACFDPADAPSAWPYPICVLEVQQSNPASSVQPTS